MAFYTPPSLHGIPTSMMHESLPPLPAELLSSLPVYNKFNEALLTPPLSSTLSQRKVPHLQAQMTLPPITYFDRQLPPLTPPDDVPPRYSPPATRLPPIQHYTRDIHYEPRVETRQTVQPEPSSFVDWLNVSPASNAHLLAEKTCEMICYVWFSPTTARTTGEEAYPSPRESSPPSFSTARSTTTLQLTASPGFVQFMQKLLETTQVSQSVIVLSLHYIYRLKAHNCFATAQSGSEFRIAVAGLMMANKFLDDNTYTNKTWAEVSGIDLAEINKMEKEFLEAVDFNLYVDQTTYESWLNLLKGLVMAKERDTKKYRKSRSVARVSRPTHQPTPVYPHLRPSFSYRSRSSMTHRSRSTSPGRTLYPTPPHSMAFESTSPDFRPKAKRTAEDAFSPTTATFSEVPSKRSSRGITLQIPEHEFNSGPGTHSPSDGLSSFAKMSLSAPSPSTAPRTSRLFTPPSELVSSRRDHIPETLVTAYSMDGERQLSLPENLYFYTLACSPTQSELEDDLRPRKARLRYHQPPPPTCPQYSYVSRHPQPIVQSASTSPVTDDVPMHFTPQYSQPHFADDRHYNRLPPINTIPASPPYSYTHNPNPIRIHEQPLEALQRPRLSASPSYDYRSHSNSPIPPAPFANNGPPGVQFYPTPIQQPVSYQGYANNRNWSNQLR